MWEGLGLHSHTSPEPIRAQPSLPFITILHTTILHTLFILFYLIVWCTRHSGKSQLAKWGYSEGLPNKKKKKKKRRNKQVYKGGKKKGKFYCEWQFSCWIGDTSDVAWKQSMTWLTQFCLGGGSKVELQPSYRIVCDDESLQKGCRVERNSYERSTF